MFGHFSLDRVTLEEQYRAVHWNEESGFPPERLEYEAAKIADEMEMQHCPESLIKARVFELIMDHAQIAVEPKEFFQDHLRHGFLLQKQRERWIGKVMHTELANEWAARQKHAQLGTFVAEYDFGHTVPNWPDILTLGLPGLLRRVEENWQKKMEEGELDENQKVFYQSCVIVYQAVIRYVGRLAAECHRVAGETEITVDQERLLFCAETLKALCEREPRTLQEGLQLAYLFHILQEEVEGERARSLGGVDRLYRKLYEGDLAAGRLNRQQAGELLKYLFQKFHAWGGDQVYGEPFYIGGALPGGENAVNDLTWLILESYGQLGIANPKIHVRVHPNNPPELMRRVCDCIRGGNSSFVFVSDNCAIPMMQKVGCTEDEAYDYVPVGCYEPGILGREVPCTGNGFVLMPKALELALNNGIDPVTGEVAGLATGGLETFDTFEKLKAAVWQQMQAMTDRALELVSAFEKHYMKMNPAPLFSATMGECVENGQDAYAGGAKYNNSSMYGYGNGTLADSLAAIYKIVYRDHLLTLGEFVRILNSNWDGDETLRLKLLRDEDKWGNDRALPDGLCVEFCEKFAQQVNARKNGRGGRFKAAMFTIDNNFHFAHCLGATPDGRKSGEPFSRNIGPVSGMDRNGITAVIRSCVKLDMQAFPNGSVLDFMLHPSAVEGEEGLDAF